MRLALPDRVPILLVIVYGMLMFTVQQAEHTMILFSLLYFAFVVLSAVAFNFAGGFDRVIGAYIFWFSLLICIVGVTWQAVLGEPGESDLQDPLLLMTAYIGSMAMLIVITAILKRVDVRPYAAGSEKRTGHLSYTSAGLGCIIFSLVIETLASLFGSAPGSALSALRQLDVFLVLGIILATIGTIKDSDGLRTMNAINSFAMAELLWQGMLAFSKQIMMTGPVCWLVAATYMRLRLRAVHVVAIIVVGILNFTVFTTLSQSRDLAIPGSSYIQGTELIVRLLSNYGSLRAHAQGVQDAGVGPHDYFRTPQNSLIDRLNMIGPDDALVSYSSKVEPLGLEPVKNDYINLIPHFLYKNKPETLSGNYYAHEVGGYLAADDLTTGISFSPVGEAFRLEGWWGIFGLLPFVWLLLFMSIDAVCGDIRRSPWGLLVVVYFAHAAPESLVAGLIYYTGFGNYGLLFAIIFCSKFAPVIGTLLYGQQKAPSLPPMQAATVAV